MRLRFASSPDLAPRVPSRLLPGIRRKVKSDCEKRFEVACWCAAVGGPNAQALTYVPALTTGTTRRSNGRRASSSKCFCSSTCSAPAAMAASRSRRPAPEATLIETPARR